MSRNPWIQGVVLVAGALVVAVVANGFASRERRLVLPGYYPNALRVPPRPVTLPSSTVAPLPASANPQAIPMTASPAPAIVPTPSPTTTTTTMTTSSATQVAPSRPMGTSATAAPAPAPTSSAATAHAAEPSPVEKFPPHPDKAYVELSGEDVAWLHAKGVLFLDARRTSVYEQAHIAGARPVSVWESDVDEKVAKLFDERSDPREQAQPIVIYCSGGACEDSHMLAQKLWGVQFNNVYVYRDGFPDWQKRGGAVRTGGQP